VALLFLGGSTTVIAQQYRVDTLARAPFSQYPVALSFAPDSSGVFLFTEKNSGRVRVFCQKLLADPFVTTSVESDGQQGLLGVTFHPSYPDTPSIYVYYTRFPDRSAILERYRDSAGISVDPTPVFIAPRTDEGTENVGGPVRFGPDGMLYLSVGDFAVRPEDAQDVTTRRNYRGKILRLHADGSHPRDNPFPNKAVWAYGLHNSQGITFDAVDGTMYCTEGGIDRPNAIFRVTRGANLGWPGWIANRDTSSGVSRPLYTFAGPRQPALTGITVYRAHAFPRLYGKLLFVGNAIPHIWAGTLTARGDSLLPEVFYTLNTGFSDIAVGPDGCIYLANGPYLSSRILRLAPIAPAFRSTPPTTAMQGLLYTYTPAFSGTPPRIRLVAAPPGMVVDTVAWTVRWTPTNEDALRGLAGATLRAENGADSIEQSFSVMVGNVNDPPSPFVLGMPGGTVVSVVSDTPEVTFRWGRSSDPDLDPVRYTLQIDTVSWFGSGALQVHEAGEADSLHISLPRISSEYYWRVFAGDGQATTMSTPTWGRLTVSVTPAAPVTLSSDQIRTATPERELIVAPDPSTMVRYTLLRAGYVRVAVFNLLGQEVARVFDGTRQEGTYEFDFNTLQLPNGIYFYRVVAPGVYDMRKMLISRPLAGTTP
jgi:glucose/arabinose dehydrogenase